MKCGLIMFPVCLILLHSTGGFCQSAKTSLLYEIDFGLSKLSKYPGNLYFQSGLNGNFSLELQRSFGTGNAIGIGVGTGISRYFIDASIVGGTLVAASPGTRQQDFSITSFRGIVSYERTIHQKLALRISEGIVYYTSQRVSYKKQLSDEIINEKSNVNILKPLSELGVIYDLGGKPDLNLGLIIRGNPFSKNFTNARPSDFNLLLRFRFKHQKK